MRSAPQGQMVINMKTTITTHGSHSGFVVHSGIQSNNPANVTASSASSNPGSMWSIAPPSRLPIVETPQGTRIVSAASPNPIHMIPSTSQENINTSWSRIPTLSPQPPGTYAHDRRYDLQPDTSIRSRSHENLSHERNRSRHESPIRRPPTPPSPIYHFTGRDSPPDEFITPSRVTLNVFEPDSLVPRKFDVGLRRAESSSSADALINDTLTTTTTVEVFRTPIDPSNPTKLVALPPPPAPGIDDRPQLLRLNGPNYERWTSQRTETLINDRPLNSTSSSSQRGVQWKENLVDGVEETNRYLQQSERYDPYTGMRSPFSEATLAPSPQPFSSQPYHIPTVHSVDPRLYNPPTMMLNRSTSPYMVKSPSEVSMLSHPMIASSHEDLRPPSATSYISAPRIRESPSQLAQIRTVTPSYLNDTPILPPSGTQSPIYVEPIRRSRNDLNRESDRYDVREAKQSTRDSRGPGDARESSSRNKRGEHHRSDREYHRSDRDDARESRGERSGRDSRSSRHRRQSPVESRQVRRGISSPHSHDRDGRESQSSRRRAHSHYRSQREDREARHHRHHRSQSPAVRTPVAVSTERPSRSRTQVSRTTYDPVSRSISIERDPNYIDGNQKKNPRDLHTTLYQTRDIMDNIVSQFQETDFVLDDGLLLSPLAESEDSLISEVSPRNDRTKSDYLELKASNAYLISNPIKTAEIRQSSDNLCKKYLDKPVLEEHVYAEPNKDTSAEHIYEELDCYRQSLNRSRSESPMKPKLFKSSYLFPKERKISKELTEFLETEEIIEEVTTTTTRSSRSKPTSIRKKSSELLKPLKKMASYGKTLSSTPTKDNTNTNNPKTIVTQQPRKVQDIQETQSCGGIIGVDKTQTLPQPKIKIVDKPIEVQLPRVSQSETSCYSMDDTFSPLPSCSSKDLPMKTFQSLPSQLLGKPHEEDPIFENLQTSTPTWLNDTMNRSFEPKPELIPPIIVLDKEVSVIDETSSSDEWPAPPPLISELEDLPPPLPTCPPPDSPDSTSSSSDYQKNTANSSKPVTIRKAHPGGLVFPRVTFSLPTLPQLPEDRELSARCYDDSGLPLAPLSQLSHSQTDPGPPKPPPPPSSLSKPKLVNTTPNVISQSHKLFITDWEDLLQDCDSCTDSDSPSFNEKSSYL